MVCQLDMEKAYDHVNWDRLDYMPKMGFGGEMTRGSKCVN